MRTLARSAAPAVITPGFLTRTGVSIALAHRTAGDPRFNWAARFRGDIDVADYGRGPYCPIRQPNTAEVTPRGSNS